MRDYEKLVLFLEMQNVDVSPFLKLKKNELAIKGDFQIFKKTSFKEVVSEKQINSEIYKNNTFFMSLGRTKYSKKLSDMMIINHKNGELVSIKEVYDDESLTEQEKHEVVYKGIERANNEYKRFISYLTINNQTVLKDCNKLIEDNKKDNKRNRLVKKNIIFFYFLAVILITSDILLLQNSYLKENRFFVTMYNSFLILLMVIPLLKKIYLKYFSNRISINNQRIIKFFSKCDVLLNINDKNFSRLEKDLYRFSIDTSKDKSITYLQKSNKVLKNLNRKVEFIFKLNSINVGDKIIEITLKVINLLPIIGLLLLLIFALI
ncbi:MAG: hypothetical protein K0Q49_1407 [Haloplasmataceae bacterium]|jgi:hypothetical protein|nr:hypothetical protein [Haloplasmataceae bacterium]